MTAELPPMLAIECGIRSRRSCESRRVDDMMKSVKVFTRVIDVFER